MSEQEMNGAATQGAAEEAKADAAQAGQPSYEEIQLMLEDARTKADEHWNAFLRSNAEMENLRKRGQRDLENAHKYALERFAGELLPVRDSLEMGLAAAAGSQADVEKIREGTELTLKMLAGAMEKFGIKEVDPQGERFDPQLHEAMTMQESADAEPNSVLLVIQKGYLLNDRLIRPARVIVAKAPPGGEEPPPRVDLRA